MCVCACTCLQLDVQRRVRLIKLRTSRLNLRRKRLRCRRSRLCTVEGSLHRLHALRGFFDLTPHRRHPAGSLWSGSLGARARIALSHDRLSYPRVLAVPSVVEQADGGGANESGALKATRVLGALRSGPQGWPWPGRGVEGEKRTRALSSRQRPRSRVASDSRAPICHARSVGRRWVGLHC